MDKETGRGLERGKNCLSNKRPLRNLAIECGSVVEMEKRCAFKTSQGKGAVFVID